MTQTALRAPVCGVKQVTDETSFSSSSVNDLEKDLEAGSNPKEEASDPWAITELESDAVKWQDLDFKGKVCRVLLGFVKCVGLLGLLYLFVCSLELLSIAFRLVGGRTAGEIFQQDTLLANPVVGVMIGILTTVLVQSSSTSTSIVVSMVAAGFLTVKLAIPIIMGANIGTSVTNTIVSLSQMGDRNEFRRAFAAATVHDMFNWLSVIVLFPVELITSAIFGIGYLEFVSDAVTKNINTNQTSGGEIKTLSVITEPFVSVIVQIDKNVLESWSNPNDTRYENASLIKQCYEGENVVRCPFLFSETGLSDASVGIILLVISLVLLCGCLIFIVKILNSMLKGQIAHVIKRVINAKIPYVPWLTGYLAMVVGAVMTFLVQSSSVFTSTLTPLVGVGVITLNRVYPLTLGSNMGTTTTSLIAALAAPPSRLKFTLQISLCHFFFNLTGILLFYPIPFTRFPVGMAKFLGDTTAKYRWFSVAYLIAMFFVLPGVVLGLSIAGILVLAIVGVPFLIVVVAVAVISILQKKLPKVLPPVLRTWKFLPLWMRSLEPADRLISQLHCCAKGNPCSRRRTSDSSNKTLPIVEPEKDSDANVGEDNLTFTQ